MQARHTITTLILAILMLAGACDFEPPHPDTPEGVVRRYQEYLDNNQFEQAKKLSTPEEQEVLESLAAIFAKDFVGSSVTKTDFLRITCQETGDTAMCDCRLRDEEETYDAVYRLVRISGKWLVDVSDSPEMDADEEIMEALEQMLEGAPQRTDDTNPDE